VLLLVDLSPSQYINDVVRKGHQRANLILRCFVSQNVNLLVRAFVVYVRPLLEYNSSVWSPSLKRDVTLIEQVQRRFTKRLRGYLDLSYHDRLNKLNLETLELRRVKSDLVLCYKVIFDIVHLNKHDFFDISTTTTSGHQFKIYKRFNSCSVRSHFFCERVVNIWNRLPVDSTDFGSLHRFRNSLDAIDDKILVDAQ